MLDVRDFGIYGDAAVDYTTAIQNLINNNPGKTIKFPAGIYLCSGLTVNKSDTNLIGEGGGSQDGAGNPQTQKPPTATTIFKYIGSSGGTLFSVLPDSAYSDGFIRHINIEGIQFDGNGLAATALKAQAMVKSRWDDLSIVKCSPTVGKGDIVLTSGGQAGETGTTANLRDNIFSNIQVVQSSVATGSGWYLTQGANIYSDVSENEFIGCLTTYFGDYAWYLDASDNNRWYGGGDNSLGSGSRSVYVPSAAKNAGGNQWHGGARSYSFNYNTAQMQNPDQIYGINDDDSNFIANKVTISNKHKAMFYIRGLIRMLWGSGATLQNSNDNLFIQFQGGSFIREDNGIGFVFAPLTGGQYWFYDTTLANANFIIQNAGDTITRGDSKHSTAGKGIIVTTPDGAHTYRLSVNNSGQIISTQVS